MYFFGNLIIAFAQILDGTLRLYTLVLIISILVSWVSPDPFNPVVRFLRMVTQPLFDWVRERMPFLVVGMLDLSPIVVFIGIHLIRVGILPSIMQFGVSLR